MAAASLAVALALDEAALETSAVIAESSSTAYLRSRVVRRRDSKGTFWRVRVFLMSFEGSRQHATVDGKKKNETTALLLPLFLVIPPCSLFGNEVENTYPHERRVERLSGSGGHRFLRRDVIQMAKKR